MNYILTTYSATMFGPRASIHQREISLEEAKARLTDDTKIVATRQSHEMLARRLFGDLPTTRFADLTPPPTEDRSAILIHYRGAPVGDDGVPPEEGTITLYLIEAETYLEPED